MEPWVASFQQQLHSPGGAWPHGGHPAALASLPVDSTHKAHEVDGHGTEPGGFLPKAEVTPTEPSIHSVASLMVLNPGELGGVILPHQQALTESDGRTAVHMPSQGVAPIPLLKPVKS